MTILDHNNLMAKLRKNLKHIRDSKGKEYSHDQDTLDNFKRNANRLGGTPEGTLMVYAVKHIDSICRFVTQLNSGKKLEDIEKELSEPIFGRIEDAINYLSLLYALIHERKEKNKKNKNDKKNCLI